MIDSLTLPAGQIWATKYDSACLPLDVYARRMSTSADSVDSELSNRTNSPSDHGSPPADHNPSRVQLPSIHNAFDEPYRQDAARRASLPLDHARTRYPYPPTSSRPQSSSLAAYQFPAPHPDQRPRLDTHLAPTGEYNDSPYTASASSAASYLSYGYGPSTAATSPWPLSAVSRPSSTGSEMQSHQLPGQDRRYSAATDYSMSPDLHAQSGSHPSTPHASIAVEQSPNPSDQGSPTTSTMPIVPSSLVERQPRKRGKLPKPVTDYLKDWLHRHADHPYPSEEEKKQLCHATGLSMSQVSNWMINARRRILAPARAAGVAPTTTTPYSAARSSSVTSNLVAGTTRRASMPSATSEPMTLHYPGAPGAGYAQSQADYMRVLPRGAYDYTRMTYYSPHSYAAPGQYVSSGMPMSAYGGGTGLTGSLQSVYNPTPYRPPPQGSPPPTQGQSDARYYPQSGSPHPAAGYSGPPQQ